MKNTAFHIGRFDYVSVREKEGVDICRDKFNVKAVMNIDPVFICDKREYITLAEQSKLTHANKYIFAYILNPTPEKRQALLDTAEKTGLDIKVVLDGQKDKEINRAVMDMGEKIIEPDGIEDWLSLIYNCDYVLTDSYHGLCFSIIFEKQFGCIANISRGLSRFTTLLEKIGLSGRMVFDPTDSVSLSDTRIDYDAVRPVLEKEINRSKEWLNNAVNSNKPCKASTYDLLMEKLREVEQKIKDLKTGK